MARNVACKDPARRPRVIDTAKDFVKELLVGNHVEEPAGLGYVGGRRCFVWICWLASCSNQPQLFPWTTDVWCRNYLHWYVADKTKVYLKPMVSHQCHACSTGVPHVDNAAFACIEDFVVLPRGTELLDLSFQDCTSRPGWVFFDGSDGWDGADSWSWFARCRNWRTRFLKMSASACTIAMALVMYLWRVQFTWFCCQLADHEVRESFMCLWTCRSDSLSWGQSAQDFITRVVQRPEAAAAGTAFARVKQLV